MIGEKFPAHFFLGGRGRDSLSGLVLRVMWTLLRLRPRVHLLHAFLYTWQQLFSIAGDASQRLRLFPVKC